MTKISKKAYKSYLHEVGKLLGYPYFTRQRVLADFASRLSDRCEQGNITFDELTAEFGSPKEVADGFEPFSQLDSIRKLRNHNTRNIILLVLLIAVVVTLAFIIYDLANSYGGNTLISTDSAPYYKLYK